MATKLNHPTIPDHSIEVPDAQVADWLAQGWVLPTTTTNDVNEEF